MMDAVAVVIVEKDDKVSAQLISNVDEAAAAFKELKGSPAEAPWRATLVTLRWREDGGLIFNAETSNLPKKTEDAWGWRLGQGPIQKPVEQPKETVDESASGKPG